MAHFILDLLRDALVQYGYWTVAVALLLENAGLPVPGETVLLMASFLAYSEHELQVWWIVLVGTVAATLGDNLGFALGFYGGRPLFARYQSMFRIQAKTLARGENLFARFGAVTVFFARFVFGMRIIAGPLAGVLHMSWRKFLLFNFLGAAVWVSAVASAGYLFGRNWEHLAGSMKRFDIVVAIVVLMMALYLWSRNRRETS
jgi:membrane-associated protein